MHTLQEWQVWYQSASVPGFEEPLLEAWDNRLAAQNVYFDACVAKHTGHRHGAVKNVAFLRIDQGLAKPAIENAVAAFIRESSWPASLTRREHLHLIVRIQLARKVVAAIREGTPQGMFLKSLMPDLGNREYALRWFLVDLWNLGGKAFLAAMARNSLGQRTESVSDKSEVEELASERTS